ncbi:MAG: phosphate/phosphite/phosphonate ABC transporter substrate-binding protein [Gammaproteobacteria bacterium]|nr:phosphate/phosphite/phosphonate ABC transporter substrate-binding protein [Gammaproteobacteria bacterium]
MRRQACQSMYSKATRRIRLVLLPGLACYLWAAPLQAADINFVVQPIIDRAATIKAYQPLADYLSKATGKKINLVTAYDFADYWLTMKQGKAYSLILDSAFYTDYRIKKMGYTPLVKVPGLVSFSLVSLPKLGYFDAEELVGRKIASLIPPSPGGLVMTKMFPNTARQPSIIPVKDSNEALKLLRSGKVRAAMVPTPVAAREMNAGHELSILRTSEQTPHIALSAGPSIDIPTQNLIRQALLTAADTPSGQIMLQTIGFTGFEKATKKTYDGYSKYLTEGWLQ